MQLRSKASSAPPPRKDGANAVRCKAPPPPLPGAPPLGQPQAGAPPLGQPQAPSPARQRPPVPVFKDDTAPKAKAAQEELGVPEPLDDAVRVVGEATAPLSVSNVRAMCDLLRCVMGCLMSRDCRAGC